MMDTIQQYFDLMKDIKENLLTFIEDNDQDTFSIFINYLDEQKITENKKKFESFLYLLVHLSNNYHRTGDLFNKIDRILYTLHRHRLLPEEPHRHRFLPAESDCHHLPRQAV